MMKLLYVPTGNVFTLPDEEALRYFTSDNANYKILDAGFVQPEEPVKLEPKTVQELVMQDKSEEEEKEDISDQVVEKEEEDLNALSKDALVAYCRRLGIKGITKGTKTKAQMIEAINKVKVNDIIGE